MIVPLLVLLSGLEHVWIGAVYDAAINRFTWDDGSMRNVISGKVVVYVFVCIFRFNLDVLQTIACYT